MELFDFMELLNKAIMKNAEDKLFKQWLIDYSRMTSETFISFADYKSKTFDSKIVSNEKLDIKKIIEDAEKIKALDQRNNYKQNMHS